MTARRTPLVLALLLSLVSSRAAGFAAEAGTSFEFDGQSVVVPFPLPLPARPSPPAAPARPPAAPALRKAVFHGLKIRSVQFSRHQRIPETLIALLDKTETEAKLALYEFRLPEVAEAVVRAHERGVKVRLILDESRAGLPGADSPRSPEFERVIGAGVETRRLRGGGSFGIMHNKMAVLDGAIVTGGSFNWTDSADMKHFENATFRDDPGVVAGHGLYWDWMWAQAKPVDAPPGPTPAPGTPPGDDSRPVSFNGATYPRYAFSPQGGIEGFLLDAIGRARVSVEVAIFSFYSNAVADALLAARGRGVVVKIVADANQARRSKAVAAVVRGGGELRLSAGREGAGVMHHKYALVDGGLLINGSYNFSQNAELYNYEVVQFTTDAAESAAYAEEFRFVFDQGSVPAPEELAPNPL